jgi:hypothetical protein
MINVYNLFAVPLTHCKAPIPINLHKKITSFVEDEYKESDTISCVKGFQFHKNFNGKKQLDNFLSIYLRNNFHLNIANSWLNVLGNNSSNNPHKHEGNKIEFAAVYYLSNNNNTIVFMKEDEIFEIEPKMFDLLIFPNDLVHYVLPEKRLNKRICYALNLQQLKESEE